jgi:hypothetical protein
MNERVLIQPSTVRHEIEQVLRPPHQVPARVREQAYKLCLLGATDAKLADFFGIAESTVNLWKKAHLSFSESITRGKDRADAEIAEALFHRAKGYSHAEDDIRTVAAEIVITPNGEALPARYASGQSVASQPSAATVAGQGGYRFVG